MYSISLISCLEPPCSFVPQLLENPTPKYWSNDNFLYHSGVAVADLNDNGQADILISAGHHNICQCYALMNLGLDNTADTIKSN